MAPNISEANILGQELASRPGNWRVTMEVEARKVVADIAGKETEVPIVEMIEIGIFAPARPGEVLGNEAPGR
jgi:hypothetical protein